ncbi:MlaD family protein [Aeromicrobium sp. CTD01-1L150]|uniref:MlaD family protein n=1 Tax=Aeromicrobium sp. CTD01-1L150 TaxID=3341830 RepID=UPI0035C193C4
MRARVGKAPVIIVGALVLVLALVAWRGGGDDSTTVVAKFASAAPLVDGNEVKIDGVVVGTVEEMTVRENLAEVSMKLDPEALPLHEDATFTIRPVSLLGERFIDLDRGDPAAPAMDLDAAVPVEQTGTNVGLDEVLNTVDEPTGEGLAALVTTLGDGLRGNGENADKTISALAPSLEDTQEMTAVLKEHNTLLASLIENFEPVARALAADDGKALDTVVGSSERLLAAAAREQKKLDRTIASLPKTLAAASTTLGELSATADETTPTLERLRPLTDELPTISKELEALSDSLDPALASSQPVLERAEELLEAAAPVARDLKDAGPDLATTVEGARPVVEELSANRENVFSYIRYWALTTNGHDGLSHYFRVNASVNPDMLTGLLPGGGEQSGDGEDSDGEAVPDVDDLTDSLKGLTGGTLLSSPEPGTKDGARSPTGLTKKQESNMVDFLLGGN